MDLPTLALTVQRELRRFDLRLQERLLADWITDLSLGSGRRSVRCPRLEWWERLTGIDRSDVSRALRALQRMAILQIAAAADDSTDYTILPDSRYWQARPLIGADETREMVARWASFNGTEQLPLWAPDPDLAAALASVSIEAMGKFPTHGEIPHEHKTPENIGDSSPWGISPRTVERLNASPLNASERAVNGEALNEGGTGGGEAMGKFPTPEMERLARCAALLGDREMQGWGGLWRKRARSNPSKLDRVLAALATDLREARPIRNPGAYANDLWRRFAD